VLGRWTDAYAALYRRFGAYWGGGRFCGIINLRLRRLRCLVRLCSRRRL